MRSSHAHLRLGVAGVAVMLAGTTLCAQPQRGRPDRQPEPPAERGQPEADRPIAQMIEPERLRERLADLLGQMEGSADRLRTAITTLDEGGSVDEVVEQLGGPLRVRRLAEMWGQWGRAGLGPMGEGAMDRQGEGRGGAGPGGPPGAGDPGQGERPWMSREATPDEVLEFLHSHAPMLAERISELRADDSPRAEAMLMRIAPRVAEVLSAREHDPELADLLERDFGLGMRFVDATGHYLRAKASGDEAASEEARAALRELAGQQVDLRLARREHELKMLVRRLEAMQGEIDRQRQDREQLIDEMVEQAGERGFRGGPGEERPGRAGPPDGSGRRERRGGGGEG
ncbi:MAG: hypothetical protein IT431_05330 [Phycisphaerales bacterium]|nr:hypothetical protein [Phycisphaerales bacterium]